VSAVSILLLALLNSIRNDAAKAVAKEKESSVSWKNYFKLAFSQAPWHAGWVCSIVVLTQTDVLQSQKGLRHF
jgi:hypothetical protein